MLLTFAATAEEGAEKYLKAFPAPEEGMARYVIMLPHKARGEEDGFRVELIVGKEILTDGVNHYRFGGSIEDQPLKGWGFTYYEVTKIGEAASTRKGGSPGHPAGEEIRLDAFALACL